MSDEDVGHRPDPQFDSDEVLGEFRNCILDEVKQHIDWPTLDERKQHAVNTAVEHCCRQAIREVVRIVHGHGFEVVPVSVSGLKEAKEGQLEAKISCEGSDVNVLRIYRSGRCSLVLADPQVFMAARPAPVMKDQPDLMDAAGEDGLEEPGETDEERTLRENGERVEAGIKPLDEPPHDPETGEVLDKPKRRRRTAEERVADRALEVAEA